MTKEIGQILEAYSKIDFNVQKAALATVVHVEGSSYRRPGARMLITDDGRLTGAISGGCLEGDALRKALRVMNEGRALVVTYDTTDEDDAKFGVGLGCNGIIHILIEPIHPGKQGNPAELLLNMRPKRQKLVLVTFFSLADKRSVIAGTRCLYTETGQEYNSMDDEKYRLTLEQAVSETFRNERSSFKEFDEYTSFIEFIPPIISLVVFGAGNDVIPLTEISHVMGWNVTVIDGRPSHAKAERFPLANQVLLVKSQQVKDFIETDDRTFFLLMTHNYNYDLNVFRELLSCRASYIGVLGPKKKLDRMQEDLDVKIENLSAVYGPVGLDIGAETAEEIALSIIAEIKAVSSARDGKFLRDISDPIHNRSAQIRFLQI